MLTKQFFAQNVMRGGVTQRTPNWILVDVPVLPDPSNYTITLTTASDSEPEVRDITPTKVVINKATKQVAALVEGLTAEEKYISRITFGPYQVDCITDLGQPIFPSTVLTRYGIHLTLNAPDIHILHNVDNLSCNGEILADFGICMYNGQLRIPRVDLWWEGRPVYRELHIEIPSAIQRYIISNARSDKYQSWFSSGLVDPYGVDVYPYSTAGDPQSFGGASGYSDLLTLNVSSNQMAFEKSITLGWQNMLPKGTVGNYHILIIDPIWWGNDVLLNGYACTLVQEITE